MAKAAYPTIGIAAFVMFGTVYFIGCLHFLYSLNIKKGKGPKNPLPFLWMVKYYNL